MSAPLEVVLVRTGGEIDETFSATYDSGYTKHFLVGRLPSIEYASQYVLLEHHEFIQGLMNLYPDESEAWKRRASNENVRAEQTESLAFNLEPEAKDYIKKYEGFGDYVSGDWAFLRFIYEAGEIFIALGCGAMAAVIGQYIADSFSALWERVPAVKGGDIIAGDYIALPDEERMYNRMNLKTEEEKKAYLDSQPSFDDIVRAVIKYFGPQPLLETLYPHIINADPDSLVRYGPASARVNSTNLAEIVQELNAATGGGEE